MSRTDSPDLFPDDPLTLDALVHRAVQQHPDLGAARARVLAAHGNLIQAGLYPNPIVGIRFSDLARPANAIGEPGLNFTQTFVTANKLDIARAAAAQGVQAADWQAVTRYYEVVTRVRLAYFELLTAQRELQASQEIVNLAEKALEAARNLQKAGAGSVPDVLRSQVELDQNTLRRATAERRVQAAQKLLAMALGAPQAPITRVEGTLDITPPSLSWQPVLETMLLRSSEIQEALARVAQAEGLVRKAQAEVIPNVEVQAIPSYSTIDRDFRIQINVVAPLPLWNKNQGNILAAQADFDRTLAEEKQIELRLAERLTTAFQRYQVAQQQAEAYQKNILPRARESLRLIEIGYKQGDPKYDYTAYLQAQQILFQAQLNQVQVLGDLWRSIADLSGLLQQDDLFTPSEE